MFCTRAHQFQRTTLTLRSFLKNWAALWLRSWKKSTALNATQLMLWNNIRKVVVYILSCLNWKMIVPWGLEFCGKKCVLEKSIKKGKKNSSELSLLFENKTESKFSPGSRAKELSNFAELVQFFHVFVNLIQFLTESKNAICIKSIYFYLRRKIYFAQTQFIFNCVKKLNMVSQFIFTESEK